MKSPISVFFPTASAFRCKKEHFQDFLLDVMRILHLNRLQSKVGMGALFASLSKWNELFMTLGECTKKEQKKKKIFF